MTEASHAVRVPRPDNQADHTAWMTHALGEGIPATEARAMTRDQIRARLSGAHEPLTGDVALERHDQDPGTRAARREARRKPWEQA